MSSRSPKTLLVKKNSSRQTPRVRHVSDWQKFLIAVGISLLLIIPLAKVAQTVNRAVLGITTHISSR